MALMGIPLVVVLACAAILIPIATLALWSRVHGPRVLRGFVRLFMLVTAQLAAVALVAVLANNYGQFYTSWSDLLGTDNTPPTTALYGAPHHNGHTDPRIARTTPGIATGKLQLLGNTTWSTPHQWATRGKVISTRLTGLRSGLSDPAYVYLPPQYFWPQYAHRRFPAVEIMSGYPGSALELVSRMDYPSRGLVLSHEHRTVPMIYVMLSSTVAPPRDTECTNIPGGPQAETFLSGELTSAVEHALRVQPGHWGVIGDSTGGYCAAKLAMFHPATYAGAVSLSGYYHALNGGTAGDLFNGSKARQHKNDLRWLLKHRAAPSANLYVTIGKRETSKAEGYSETMKFLHLVKPPMHVTAVIEANGGHNFRTWARELPAATAWLSRRMTAPTTALKPNHHRLSIPGGEPLASHGPDTV